MNFDPDQIKLIVGLGNVGKDYSRTRHNIGFMLVDEIVERLDTQVTWGEHKKLKTELAKLPEVKLAKPTTMMNFSGDAVSLILNYFNLLPKHMLVIHDDMDINLGSFKLQYARGPIMHNGVDSIERKLKSDKFWRLRLGIENRPIKGNKGIPGMTFALQKFTLEEMEKVKGTIDSAIKTHLSQLLQS